MYACQLYNSDYFEAVAERVEVGGVTVARILYDDDTLCVMIGGDNVFNNTWNAQPVKGCPFTTRYNKTRVIGKVQEGAYQQYDCIRDTLNRRVNVYITACFPVHIAVIGHGLHATSAILCAIDIAELVSVLAESSRTNDSRPYVKCFAFGCPRFSCKRLRRYCTDQSSVLRFYLMSNQKDMVPNNTLPGSRSFCHVAPSICIHDSDHCSKGLTRSNSKLPPCKCKWLRLRELLKMFCIHKHNMYDMQYYANAWEHSIEYYASSLATLATKQ